MTADVGLDALEMDLAKVKFESAGLDLDDALLQSAGIVRLQNGTLRPTNTGVLLFGKDPQALFPDAYMRCGRYRTNSKDTRIASRDLEKGPLIRILDDTSNRPVALGIKLSPFRPSSDTHCRAGRSSAVRFASPFPYTRLLWARLRTPPSEERATMRRRSRASSRPTRTTSWWSRRGPALASRPRHVSSRSSTSSATTSVALPRFGTRCCSRPAPCGGTSGNLNGRGYSYRTTRLHKALPGATAARSSGAQYSLLGRC